MKKIFTLLTVLLVFSMLLVACGPEEVENNEPTNTTTDTDTNTTTDTDTDTDADAEVDVPVVKRKGGWLDQVSMSVVSAESAVTQIVAGAIDIYASGLSTPQDQAAIAEAGLSKSQQYGTYYELTLNPAGDANSLFPGTGKLNPFDSMAIREAMHWIVDRTYISDEIYGGVGIPKFISVVSGFPDYARYVEFVRPYEQLYAYDFARGEAAILAAMTELGAVASDDGFLFPPTFQDDVAVAAALVVATAANDAVTAANDALAAAEDGADTTDLDATVAAAEEAATAAADALIAVSGWSVNLEADLEEWELVGMKLLVRTDSDGTRKPMGEYVAAQLEKAGFAVVIQYGTSSELSPFWTGDGDRGVFNLYTGAWGASAISRNNGDNWYWFGTPESSGWLPLHAAYTDVTPEYQAAATKLNNNDYANLDERRELFKTVIAGGFANNYRIWMIDGVSSATWLPSIEVSYDLAAGVDTNTLWPHTLRYTDSEGGTVNWGAPDLFVDPSNPVGGSNWVYDGMWQNATDDHDLTSNPHTGVQLPQRLESAEIYVPADLPIARTYDWVTINYVDTNVVPGGAWVDWDPVGQKFITADEKFPDGLESINRVVVTYPADIFDTITWHDGSAFSMGDFLMPMVLSFARGTPGDPLFDFAQESSLTSWLSVFKGFNIVSVDPPVLEFYTDNWDMDAEANIAFKDAFWPEYGYGNGSWHMIAVSNMGEAANTLAYGKAKADDLEVPWMNFIGGPTLALLDGYLDEAIAASTVPFPEVFGAYVTAEEAATRYANLKAFFTEKGHFWVGTGPYILDKVFLVEKTATLVQNANYVDDSDRWSMFAEPKISVVEVEGPGIVSIGSETVFDVFVTYGGEAYAADEISIVKYLLFDATSALLEVGEAVYVSDGYYTVTLSAATTGALTAGANKLEVLVVAIPVSIPTFSSIEFVTE